MEFTHTAEYALRAMAFLASVEGKEPARAPDLATVTHIPRHYLSKVMRKLVVAGLVTSQKGHGGGFVLARDPNTVRFIDVLRAAGYGLTPDRCAFGAGHCDPHHTCPLHPAWSELNQLFTDWAERTTLADLQKDPALVGQARLLDRSHRRNGAASHHTVPAASLTVVRDEAPAKAPHVVERVG